MDQPRRKRREFSTRMEYKIYSSNTGELLCSVQADETQIENLSSDNAEGHFRADRCDEIIAAGVEPGTDVYALCA